ncbi:F-box protein-like protein isoform X1 [Tanacetum coccineum]
MTSNADLDIGGRRESKRLTTDTSSANAVGSNDKLLIEILLLLPAISLFLYKSVSKQWRSLIKCPDFTLRLSQKPNIDPSFGLFVWGSKSNDKRKNKRNMFEYDFISFDIRIPSKISTVFTFNSNTPAKILQSCNGLLLCYIDHSKYYYVYNPFTNMSKMLPRPKIYVQPHIIVGGIRLVFDPTKSPHYKVVHAGIKTDDNFDDFDDYDFYNDCDGYDEDDDRVGGSYVQVEIYSSEIGKWRVYVKRFGFKRFHGFEAGIYSNGALHWLNFTNGRYWHAKLNILVGNLVLRTIQLPVTLDGELFCDPKFFESRGCLLLVCKDDPDSRQLNIFEMRNGYSEWSPKYLINLDDIMTPLPQNWGIYSSVWCIVLGEREEDSFMVIESYEKVLQYKIVLKTVHTLFEMESTSPHESFPFIASFAHV